MSQEKERLVLIYVHAQGVFLLDGSKGMVLTCLYQHIKPILRQKNWLEWGEV